MDNTRASSLLAETELLMGRQRSELLWNIFDLSPAASAGSDLYHADSDSHTRRSACPQARVEKKGIADGVSVRRNVFYRDPVLPDRGGWNDVVCTLHSD